MKTLFSICISALHCVLVLAPMAAMAQVSEPCGSLENHYGPFDYRTANRDRKRIVENAHFTQGVETLTRGMTGPFGGDIAYTLRVFPNHPRALLAMERLVVKEKRNPAQDGTHTIECYYERAIRFQPDDALVRMLYVNFLIPRNKLEEAHRHLAYVVETTQDIPLTQFNAGMLYMDMKDYERALMQAHRVIALGIDRPELKARLVAAGRWVDPPATQASAPASAAH